MNQKTQRILIWAVAALAIFGVFAVLFWAGRTIKDITPLKDGDWVRGNKNASVIVTEYADFECPSCGITHGFLKEAEKEFGDKIAVVFRHYPIMEIHQNALPAAWASEAAGKQGKFWEMHDLLFERQDFWKNEKEPLAKFVDYAETLGLNKDQFTKDYLSSEVQIKVAEARKASEKDGINSTPSLFINGKHLTTFVQTYDQLKTQLNQALGATK